MFLNSFIGLISVLAGAFLVYQASQMTNLTDRSRFSKAGYLLLLQSFCCFLKRWFTSGTLHSILNIVQLLCAIAVFVVLFWKLERKN